MSDLSLIKTLELAANTAKCPDQKHAITQVKKSVEDALSLVAKRHRLDAETAIWSFINNVRANGLIITKGF